VQLRPLDRFALLDRLRDFLDGHGRVNCAHVHERLADLAVKTAHATDRRGSIQLEDERDVLVESDRAVHVQVLTKRRALPVAALILTEIENLERATVRHPKKSLP